jgi:outer membrane protein assembly factor BamB
VVVGDAVVVTGGDGAVRAYDRSAGEPLWARWAAQPVTAPLLQRREVVLVTTTDGWLHRLDAATGRLAGSARAGRGAVAALNPGAGPAVFTVDASDAVTGLRLR